MALVVEDGTGKTDAESYVSVADTDAYWTAHGAPTSWSGASTAEKEEALRMATQYLDLVYHLSWIGRRISNTQALDWPRYGVTTPDWYIVESDTIPSRLEDATSELALRHLTETDGLLPDVSTERGVKRESIRVGEIESDIEYGGARPMFNRFSKVDALVSDLVRSANYIPRA